MKHIRSLDGIRFLAVALVLMEHWLDGVLPFAAGYLGVCLFFVLSGFLIANILFKAKLEDDSLQIGHGRSLKLFFIRRTIRIFPVYYLMIIVIFFLGERSIRQFFWWSVTYTSNFYIAFQQTWMGASDHLWSLAVEEQFYIFFPFIVFYISLKNLPKVFAGFVLLAIILRAYFYFSGYKWMTSYVLMPTCLDAFGLGGLMAYFFKFKRQQFETFFQKRYMLFTSILLYALLSFYIHHFEPQKGLISVVFLRFFESTLSLFLIGNAIIGLPYYNSFLENKWVVYVGKISYGVYVFHNFIYNPFHSSQNHWLVIFFRKNPIFDEYIILKFVFLFMITIAIASISWFCIEKPINKLKDKFEY